MSFHDFAWVAPALAGAVWLVLANLLHEWAKKASEEGMQRSVYRVGAVLCLGYAASSLLAGAMNFLEMPPW